MPRNRSRPADIGNQRDSKGRAFNERFSPSLAPGAGITAGSGTLYKSSVVRVGDRIVTSILMDLTGLASTTTDLDIIGTTGVCHIGYIDPAVCGTILSGTMRCLETPATGADDIDLYSATVGTGAYDVIVTNLDEAVCITNGAAWAANDIKSIVPDSISSTRPYLYLTCGEAGTVGTYSAGRFEIELVGYAA